MILWVDWAQLSCPHLISIKKIVGGSLCDAGQEATVRTGHGTTEWFQIGKVYFKAAYCHPAYLTHMQSTS